MIFVGDIALPFVDSIQINLSESFNDKTWFGNLEGPLIDNLDVSIQKEKVVFNDIDAFKQLNRKLQFNGFALANNHIFDTGSLNQTIQTLEQQGIPFCGIGENISEASKPLILNEGEKQIVIVNFGWEVIQCEITTNEEAGVNPLRKDHVLSIVKKTLLDFPDSVVIAYFHWSYELEGEPQPFERELAKELIDLGVAGIIGCHPHRIGGFEMHNGKPIIYSLGNWMFKQNYYHNGNLRFPSFCNEELAFEWDFNTGEFKFHFFEYNDKTSELTYLRSENYDSDSMLKYTPFKGLNNEEYKGWYKKNHYHKGKGLPIYYWEDNNLKVVSKNFINKVRDLVLHIYLKYIRNR